MKYTPIVLYFVFLKIISCAVAQSPSFAEMLLKFFVYEGGRQYANEPRDRSVVEKEYDFIIVGAGSAGCVVANRLSEIKEWKVLLIEAGGSENILMDVPILVNYFQFSNANWKYRTLPSPKYCLAMENGQCHWPRGKVMGGSSVLNYMIYTRGNRQDYDNWEALGNKGWGWNSVLPYFRKLENSRSAKFRNYKNGNDGYLPVSDVPYQTTLGKAFVESGRLMGYPILDYNLPYHNGFNHLLVSMANGTRWSSSKAFLHPARLRNNLHVKKRALVTRIIIDPNTKRAVGVELKQGREKYVVRARKEVILSAGAINSPQLLMLSGVGPRRHLTAKNITVIKNSKVGYNLQDHYLAGGVSFTISQPMTLVTNRIIRDPSIWQQFMSEHKGIFTSPGGCEAAAFINVDNTTKEESPNMELLFVIGGISSDDSLYRSFNLNNSIYNELYGPVKDNDTVSILPVLLSPKSRGRIFLNDNVPTHHPLIYPNYFSDPEGYDMRNIIAGIRVSNKVMSMAPFKKYQPKPIVQSFSLCNSHGYDTDDYWNCYARYMTFTLYHPVGTCKMGPDSDSSAVVDDRLRVRGIKGLRVIDASIMPVIPRTHTNGPTYMIAEKGSDMIREDWGIGIVH